MSFMEMDIRLTVAYLYPISLILSDRITVALSLPSGRIH